MWQSYWEDPWVLADWPLLRRRSLEGEVLVHPTDDGIAARIPADGFESVVLAGTGAGDLLGDEVTGGADRVLVVGRVPPSTAGRLGALGYERRRSWDWYSVTEDVGPSGVVLEELSDLDEVLALLESAYPSADRRTTTGGRWWGLRRDGVLLAAGAADTWRGQGPDGSVDWNSHIRSFTVHRDHRGEGIGTAAFLQLVHEEWRRSGWVQWAAWSDAEDTRGLMDALGYVPVSSVTNFRPAGQPSSSTGYPGAHTA